MSLKQIAYYGLVGFVSNLVGFIFYLILTHLGATPKITMTAIYLSAAAVAFFGNSKLTFRHKRSHISSGVRFIAAHGCGYVINFATLFIFVDTLDYPHQWVQGAAIVVVAAFLFLVLKYFVFRDDAEPSPE